MYHSKKKRTIEKNVIFTYAKNSIFKAISFVIEYDRTDVEIKLLISIIKSQLLKQQDEKKPNYNTSVLKEIPTSKKH